MHSIDVRTSTAKPFGHTSVGSKTEVSQPELCAIFVNEDIIRLEVTMEDALSMTEPNGVEELDEDFLHQLIVSTVCETLADGIVEVTTRAIVQNDVDEPVVLEDLMHRHDIGVLRDASVSGNLTLLITPLAGERLSLHKHLDSVLLRIGVGRR